MRIFSPSGALWKHADFMRLWAAQSISSFGARIARDGIPLAAVLTIHAPPSELGILAAALMAPNVVVGLFAGGYIDRARKRRVMIASDLARALLLATIPLAAWFHLLAMAQLYGVALLAGAAGVFFDIADHAYLPELIGREAVVEGNSKFGVTESVAEIGGPALAGLLVQLLTAPIAIAVNAATYLLSALFLFSVRHRDGSDVGGKRDGWRADFGVALRTLLGDQVTRPLALLAVLSPFFGMFFGALYSVYAIRVLGFTPSLLGVTIAVGGIASLIGAAVAEPMSRRLGPGPAIVVSLIGSAASALLIPLASGPLAARVAMMMASQLGGDMFGTVAIILTVSLRQTVLPRALLGRTAAALRVGAGLSGIAGALSAGFLGDAMGVRRTLMLAAIGYGLSGLVGVLSPLRSLYAMPAAAERNP